MREDHKVIFQISSAASKAADYILGFSNDQEEVQIQESVAARVRVAGLSPNFFGNYLSGCTNKGQWKAFLTFRSIPRLTNFQPN